MDVILDARVVGRRPSGVGRYALGLIRALAKIPQQQLDPIRFIVLRTSHGVRQFPEGMKQVEMEGDPFHPATLLKPGFPLNPMSIYHALVHFVPRAVTSKAIVLTLHDLIWTRCPRMTHPNPVRAFFTRTIGGGFIVRSIARAAQVICISHATENSYRQGFLDGPPATVIWHGVEPHFFQPGPAALLPRAVSERPFILSVGHGRPYKNIPRLMTAFSIALPHLPKDTVLALVGRGDHNTKYARMAEELSIAKHFLMLPMARDDLLASMYRNALIVAQPSLIEGFGFPILEALAAGGVLLTSNVSSPKEIAGEAALKVNPESIEEISQGLILLANDAAFAQSLRGLAPTRARTFTWEKAAAETLEVYRKISLGR